MGVGSGQTEGARRGWLLGADAGRLLRLAILLPALLLTAALALVTLLCAGLMADRLDGVASADSETILLLATGTFLLVSAAVVVMQAMRVAHRVAGPEYRLIHTLRRVRSGDLTVRVHLRRGDLLRELAEECNAVIEWLNANPPRDARLGGDLVEMTAEAEEAEWLAAGEPVDAACPVGQGVGR